MSMLERIREILYWKKMYKPKYPLKFFDTNSQRLNVSYNNYHLCTCAVEQREEVQKYFDKNYDGENLKIMSEKLKQKYNLVIQVNRKKGYKKKKKVKTLNYRTAKLCFNPTPNGRVQVKVRDKKRTHCLCCCYPEQEEEIRRKYDLLKKDNSLETIKIIFKKEYNLQDARR